MWGCFRPPPAPLLVKCVSQADAFRAVQRLLSLFSARCSTAIDCAAHAGSSCPLTVRNVGQKVFAREETLIPGSFEYHRPSNLGDAIALARESPDSDARLIAGGHSLIPMMKLRLAQPSHLIDLAAVLRTQGIRLDGRRYSS